MRITIVCAVALLAGCVGASEIVPAGKDSYMVAGRANAPNSQGQSLLEATKAANAYCAKDGKFMVIRHTDIGGTVGFGGEHANLIFSCVSADDPEYARPNLRRDNGVSSIDNR